MGKERNAYDSRIAEKANTPFARRLQDLITKSTVLGLKERLGCSLQAINQYKQGTAFPKTENLIKIADYYGISVDYLLGRTDIPNLDTNMQAVHGFTGLSAETISRIVELRDNGKAELIDKLISNPNFSMLIKRLAELQAMTHESVRQIYDADSTEYMQSFYHNNGNTNTAMNYDSLQEIIDLKEYQITKAFAEIVKDFEPTKQEEV